MQTLATHNPNVDRRAPDAGSIQGATERPSKTLPPDLGHRGFVSAGRYNRGVDAWMIEDVKRFVGFDGRDAAALASLQAPLGPCLARVAKLFYETLNRHPHARAVFANDEQLVRRLHESFGRWLEELFSGRYDAAYFEGRLNIGRAHVRINLPQQYMFTGMNIVRLELIRELNRLNLPDSEEKIAALEKLLDLELAVMNYSYHESMVQRMQETERSEYEERLSETRHLATVGELAASLAHEIKNPLAGISGAIQIIGAALEADHPHREIIEEALRQIDRLDAAVKDLLIYARPKPPEKVEVNLSALVERVMLILQEEPAFRSVRFRLEASKGDFRIEADEHQIQQLLTNLFLNAAHACSDGGEIVCRIRQGKRGVRCVVEDNGVGMGAAVLARVYEPFFTTKARGTGLGLSICKRIVEAHGGRLEIESKLGTGTRVAVELPGRETMER